MLLCYSDVIKCLLHRVHQERMDYQVIQAREANQWVTFTPNKATYLVYGIFLFQVVTTALTYSKHDLLNVLTQ